MVYVFLADGFEEVEAICPVDILRRGGIEVKTVGVGGKTVTGAHGIRVVADITADEAVFENTEAVILPGGMPGTLNLKKDSVVNSFIDYAVKNELILAAICAAPSILGQKGILKGKRAVCYSGFEKELVGAEVLDIPAVREGNIITACGAGAAAEFGFLLLEALCGDEQRVLDLKKGMKYLF